MGCPKCGKADAEAVMRNQALIKQLAQQGIESFMSNVSWNSDRDGIDLESFTELKELMENMDQIAKGEICRCLAPQSINYEVVS